MDSNGKASDIEHRSSLRRSLRLSTGPSSDGDDDYDLNAMMVADGFRPSDHDNNSFASASRSSQPRSEDVSPSTPTAEIPEPISSTTPQQHLQPKGSPGQTSSMRTRPSSISKPPRNHDSLTLRNDGTSSAPVNQTHGAQASTISSDDPVMRAESPYRGPLGPSHPYQMYPQRTMSVNSTSTAAPQPAPVIPQDGSYNGPGPAHPYALYPQSTVPTNDSSSQIPVGFNNMGNTYQRQIGPDGEEAGDMIGPLGHMEELPPYSRYPDNAFVPENTTASTTNTRETSAPDASPATTEPIPDPDRTISGAGGIGIATRDPEFSSTEDDLTMPRTRPSVRSNQSTPSQHDVNTAARDAAEKPKMSKWERRGKKKLWNIIPYWAICLVALALIIMGVVMGAVLGTLLTRHKKGPPPSQTSCSSLPSKPTGDVTYLTSMPTDLAQIATGHYGLPPFKVSQESKSCINDTTKAIAWSCQMPFSYYSMDVLPNKNSSASPLSGYELVMAAFNATNAEFIWGAQPPSILKPATLTLVYDTYEPGRGPAWWTTYQYNKTVIISDSDFSSLSQRGWDHDNDHPFSSPGQYQKKNKGAKEGDKPWICTWPDVTVEIFIYPKQNISSHWPTTSTYSAMTPTATGPNPSATYQIPPYYPKVLKMLELRYVFDKSQIAFCSHVEIVDEGKSFIPVKDKDGNPEEVTILEDYPWSKKLYNRRYRHIPKRWMIRDMLARGRSLELTKCGCLWWST
ncbi:hypothetical protein BGZ63DRAFT_399209 [Mariannaea sp. PMI_226]|nr:hypothetical protein BGZ63DRAFT_399209 [Mariannaea sp. PMI_226]